MGYYDPDDNDNGYEEKKEWWRNRLAEEFIQAVRSLLKDEVWDIDIALALAFNHQNRSFGEPTLLFDHLGLSDDHAICLIDYMTNKYDEEVTEAFDKIGREECD